MAPVAAFSPEASLVNTAGEAPAPGAVNTAGIPVVTGVVQPRPRSEAEAQAVSDAQVFAEDHREDVGYPWLDPSTGTVELSAASKEGRVILDGESLALRAAGGSTPKISVRDTNRSMADLMAISDDVTLLRQQGVPDAELIYMTAPDFEANRIVIRVGAPSTKLFAELARRYGTEAIAVWIDPSPHDASTLARQADVPDFWGGAAIVTPSYGCSDAFSWSTGSIAGDALLTAAHCIPSGGNVKIGTSSTVRGTVTASSGENWSATNGTQYFSGQGTYHGDLALIRLNSSYRSDSEIYRGGPTSSSHSTVTSRLLRYSYQFENVFVGGARTGETGPYLIDLVNTNVWYNLDGPNVIARNVDTADLVHAGTAIDHGDSGGSVFRVNSSGNIIAVGVESGRVGDSKLIFTDIYHAFLGLPGDVNLLP
jgi:hypothetical protein